MGLSSTAGGSVYCMPHMEGNIGLKGRGKGKERKKDEGKAR
jgi:hypothetical protein